MLRQAGSRAPAMTGLESRGGFQIENFKFEIRRKIHGEASSLLLGQMGLLVARGVGRAAQARLRRAPTGSLITAVRVWRFTDGEEKRTIARVCQASRGEWSLLGAQAGMPVLPGAEELD